MVVTLIYILILIYTHILIAIAYMTQDVLLSSFLFLKFHLIYIKTCVCVCVLRR